jgi:signal transduction histidine kinase
MLQDFIRAHRAELLERARAKVASRSAPRPTHEELASGIPIFLTQLEEILELQGGDAGPDAIAMARTATRHGSELLERGFTVGQVVHDYGDVCQAVTQLAMELEVPIETADFKTLNRCLDEAIASAVTEYSSRREANQSRGEIERLGVFAHELRNLLGAATLAFHALKNGEVGVNGSTGAVLERSLLSLARLVDSSLSEVRLGAGVLNRARISLPKFIEEIEIGAALEAKKKGLQLTVTCACGGVAVDADRHLLASAVANLLQNAIKFTARGGHVSLRAGVRDDRVVIEVEDECGGLPGGNAAHFFRPFEQSGQDRTGIGLGLTIAQRAVEANGGTIAARDLPAKGCVFLIELPLSKDAALGALPGT